MRKLLFVLLITLLMGGLGFIVVYGVDGVDFLVTYEDLKDEYDSYQTALKNLNTKNDTELPTVEAKLDPEDESPDNVINKYNIEKARYEDLLVQEKLNKTMDQADIYEIEYLWTNIGKHANKNFCELQMDVVQSDADLDAEDYIMCNVYFKVVGMYSYVAEFFEDVENDNNLDFRYNDFFLQTYAESALFQKSDVSMDTNDIGFIYNTEEYEGEEEKKKLFEILPANTDVSVAGKSQEKIDEHKLDVEAIFVIYNVPLNRRTVTNIKKLDELKEKYGVIEDSDEEDDEEIEEEN